VIVELDFDGCFFYDLGFSPFEAEGMWEGASGCGEYLLSHGVSQQQAHFDYVMVFSVFT